MKKPRLAILASGSGRTICNIASAIKKKEIHAEIALVILSSKKIPAVKRCQELELDTLIIDKESYPTGAKKNDAILGAIYESNADLTILAGWLHLLPIPPNLEGKVLNIHPSLLPEYGGKGFYGQKVHEAVFRDSKRISGCTIHFASQKYDEGPIVLQTPVSIEEEDTPEAIAEKVFKAETYSYPEAIKMVLEGYATYKDGKVVWDA